MRSMADVFTQINSRPINLLLQLDAGHNNWNSNEHVQSWIDNLTESELVSRASESSSPTKLSFESDVFLQCPSADDLVLGAEARYYGNCSVVSPRLSPLITTFMAEDDAFITEDDDADNADGDVLEEGPKQVELKSKQIETSSLSTDPVSPAKLLDHILLERRKNSTGENKLDEDSITIEKPKLGEKHSCSSWASSFDTPSSLAAALYTDPEELLYSLGFGQNFSLENTIPSRFFQEDSQANGINVADVRGNLLMGNEESQYSSYEESTSNPILRRFSESSVDLNSHTSSDSLHANRRRVLFSSSRNDIPSIHLSRDENDRSLSPLSVGTSGSNNWMRLETLEELPEPLSRSGSFESDRLTNEAIAAFLAASASRMETLADDDSNSPRRKLSEQSQLDTLICSPNGEDRKDGADKHDDSKSLHLHMPLLYKRSNSDKSLSSVVTVINMTDAEKMSTPLSRSSTLKQASVASDSRVPQNELSEIILDKNMFQPIAECRSPQSSSFSEIMQDSTNVNINETRADIGSPPSSRRKLFRLSKGSKFDLDENEFESNDDTSDVVINSSLEASDANLSMQPPSTNNSFNESFKEFVQKLKDSEEKQLDSVSVDEQRPVEIVVTPVKSAAVDGTCRGESKKTEEESEISCKEQLLSFDRSSKQRDTSYKKKYFSAAMNSLAKVFGKYQDSKPSQCNDIINNGDHQSNSDVKSNQVSPSRTKKSKIFKIFNHQTFAAHSNSAFSAVATGLINGEVMLDREDEAWTQQYNPLNKRKQPVDLCESDVVQERDVQDCLRMSDSSIEQNCSSALGYVADSASSEDCNCPTGNMRKKRSNSRKLTKGHSMESSGFDDELIKCPLGKNCSITHVTLNHKDAQGKQTNDKTSGMLSHADRSGTPQQVAFHGVVGTSNVEKPMTHEHFDYLVQQFTTLRAEVKSEFAKVEEREHEMELNLKHEVQETKKFLTSEYMNWIIQEMNSLKLRLQEKDEEIRRLRDLICQK